MSDPGHDCVWVTRDAGQLAVLKAVFESSGIKYFVSNENFSQAHGMAIPAEVFVSHLQAAQARELIEVFIRG